VPHSYGSCISGNKSVSAYVRLYYLSENVILFTRLFNLFGGETQNQNGECWRAALMKTDALNQSMKSLLNEMGNSKMLTKSFILRSNEKFMTRCLVVRNRLIQDYV